MLFFIICARKSVCYTILSFFFDLQEKISKYAVLTLLYCSPTYSLLYSGLELFESTCDHGAGKIPCVEYMVVKPELCSDMSLF